MDKIVKFIDFEIKDVNDDDRSFTAIASTATRDRDGDILEQSGWKLGNFRKNPVVMFGHDYRSLPVAKAVKIGVEDGKLMFRPKFVDKDVYPFADTVYQMYKSGFMRAFSVGFVPIKSEELDNDDEKSAFRSGRRFTKQELLEISAVPVPSNPDAMASREMQDMMIKGLEKMKKQDKLILFDDNNNQVTGDTDEWDVNKELRNASIEDLKITCAWSDPNNKQVTGDTDEWDVNKELRNASIEDLKIMCAWSDPNNKNSKSGYKLPYCRQGNKNVSLKGLSACMAALLGARGGVSIPEGDKKDVYNKLINAYKCFPGTQLPRFRIHTESELKDWYDDIWHDELADLIDLEAKQNDELDYIKSGRVLSDKNKNIVKTAVSALEDAIESLKNVLSASEIPNPDEPKQVEYVDEKKVEELHKTIKSLKEELLKKEE
jgi:HK97 family phage prohead protease